MDRCPIDCLVIRWLDFVQKRPQASRLTVEKGVDQISHLQGLLGEYDQLFIAGESYFLDYLLLQLLS